MFQNSILTYVKNDNIFYGDLCFKACEEVPMRTYIDVYFDADGEKASKIFQLLSEMGLKHHIGEHDYFYEWKGIADITEELEFIDAIQKNSKELGRY